MRYAANWRPANGELRLLSSPGDSVTALLRSDAADARYARDPIVIMINPDLAQGHRASISLRPLPPTAGASLSVVAAISADRDASEALDAGEVRMLRAKRNDAVKLRRTEVRAAILSAAPRIVVEAVTPSVDAGRFAAKRVIGETVTVEADVFADGHDILVVECLWRACDSAEWQRAAMQSLGNDRWQAKLYPRSASAVTNSPSRPGSTATARCAATLKSSARRAPICPSRSPRRAGF